MENINDLPWIIFELNKQLYAVSTELVTGIIQFPPITFVPEAPDLFLGVANIRGQVIPILELRKLLKMRDIQEDTEKMIAMFNERKNDHIKWVKELRRCIESGEKFTLATDPRKCAFGKWYYSYCCEDDNMAAQLKQLEAPHSQLHEYAKKIEELREKGEENSNTVSLLLKQAELCSKNVVRLIEQIIEYISESLTRMVITLSDKPSSQAPCMGFAVDNIKGVETLEIINNREKGQCLFMSNHICGVAHSEKFSGEILIADDKEIIKMVKVFNDSVKNEEQ